MAVSYQVPGVYIQEVTSARSIQGVSTDIALFIGMPANYGLSKYPDGYPVPDSTAPTTAQLITSWSQYQTTFGQFTWGFNLAYAVYNFFASGGTACYVLNSISPETSAIAAYLPAGTAGYNSSKTEPVETLPSSIAINVVSPWLSYTTTTASSTPSDASSVSGKSKSSRIALQATGTTTVSGSDIYIMTNYDNPPEDSDEKPDNPLFSIYVLVEVKDISSSDDSSTANNELKTDDDTVFSNSNQQLQYYARANNASLYQDATTKKTYYILERFAGLSSADLAINPSTGLANIQKRINGYSLFITISILNNSKIIPALSATLQPIGVQATIALQTTVTDTTKLSDVLDTLQDVSIVASPDNPNSTKQTQTSNINTILSALETTNKAIAVVDSPYYPPDGKDHTTAVLGFVQGQNGSTLNSSYGAIYYPWVWVMNPNTGNQLLIPPSGLVVGRYAYTSNSVGIFGAPAGIVEGQLKQAINVAENVTSGDQQILNPAGINVIKSLLGYGICIWGARTFLQGNTFYVNVRRLLIYIEQSIYQSIQWVVFQANNSILWGTVTRDINAFLYNLWQQGALVGTSASEAYYVICDASNNTSQTMAQGILYVDIGVAPVTPAEFVVIRIAQIVQTA